MLSFEILKNNELEEEFDIDEFSKEENKEDYVIGEGAFGKVYKGLNKKDKK